MFHKCFNRSLTIRKYGDGNIGKPLLALGVVLIIAGGLLVYGSSPFKAQSRVTQVLVKDVTAQSSVSADLQKGDGIVVEVRYGTNWARPPYETDTWNPQLPILDAFLEIRDPTGNSTEFDITYTPSGSTLSLWNLSVTRENLSGLNTTVLYNQMLHTYDGIGGIVGYNGTYKVVLTDTWPTKTDPPAYLGVYKGKIVTEYPYISLLPMGVATGALGAVTLFFGLRNPKPKPPLRKRSSRLSRHKNTR